MDVIDFLDIPIPIYWDIKDVITPYINYGFNGEPPDINCTEAAAGSSPVRSTELSPQVGDSILICLHIELFQLDFSSMKIVSMNLL